jgi:hypothetical protein
MVGVGSSKGKVTKISSYFLFLDEKKVTKKNQDRHPSRVAPPF